MPVKYGYGGMKSAERLRHIRRKMRKQESKESTIEMTELFERLYISITSIYDHPSRVHLN